MGTKAKAAAWFAGGANAIHRVLQFEVEPCHRRVYMCPLCGRFHPAECLGSGELTFEHVPPRSVGGRELVLTCATCNHGGNQQFDRHAAAQAKSHAITSFTSGETRIRFDDGTNALLRIPSQKVLQFVVSTSHNPEGVVDEFFNRLSDRIEANRAASNPIPLCTFMVPQNHDDRRASLSYVRAAFLTAFATFGYRLILGRSYMPVRRQLRYGSERVLSRLPIAQAQPAHPPLAVVFVSGLGPTLTVRFGDRFVMLPASTEDCAWWDRLSAAPVELTLKVHETLSVPTEPMHRLDIAPFPRDGRSWRSLDFVGDRGLVPLPPSCGV